MNYDKIILELMGRIQDLEETVAALQSKVEGQEEPTEKSGLKTIVTTVEKQQKEHRRKKRRMEGYYVKSVSTKPRIFQSD